MYPTFNKGRWRQPEIYNQFSIYEFGIPIAEWFYNIIIVPDEEDTSENQPRPKVKILCFLYFLLFEILEVNRGY